MAIGAHIARLTTPPTAGASGEPRVVADGSIPNTSGGPTLVAYLALELAADYVPNVITDRFVITLAKADL